ncbi:MAG: MBL fold metallo-hydrolase [Tannerellaceae bacterium]|nr:MBL fold metallo-hydrolase [Tannerellaceae bacterium]
MVGIRRGVDIFTDYFSHDFESGSDFIFRHIGVDDSALVYQDDEGLFIITGCSHSGICNIIEYAKQVCQEERVLGVIGGFHLFDNSERLQRTIAYFKKNAIGRIYPSHCVSLAAKAEMFKSLPVYEVGVGLTINAIS